MKFTKAQRKAFRKQWVRALRSGKYKQTKNVLNNGHGAFCCLGVACHLFSKKYPRALHRGRAFSNLNNKEVVTYDGEKGALPDVVCEALGISRDGDFQGGSLAWLNDQGKRFIEIAKVIESEPKGLFK